MFVYPGNRRHPWFHHRRKKGHGNSPWPGDVGNLRSTDELRRAGSGLVEKGEIWVNYG